jgi:hypothetical protein
MASNRNTIIRSLHDLGAAAWFGGSLMGAIGVNGDRVRDQQGAGANSVIKAVLTAAALGTTAYRVPKLTAS